MDLKYSTRSGWFPTHNLSLLLFESLSHGIMLTDDVEWKCQLALTSKRSGTSHVHDDMIFLIHADLIRGLSGRPSVDQKRSRAPVGRGALHTPWVTCARWSSCSGGACGARHAKFGQPGPRGEHWHNHERWWVAVPRTHHGQLARDGARAHRAHRSTPRQVLVARA